MVKNNRTNEKALRAGNAEKARIEKSKTARKTVEENEEQERHEGHKAGGTKDQHKGD